jgi:hypothetical protein
MFIVISCLYLSCYLSPCTCPILKPQHGPLYYALNIWKQHNPIKFQSLMQVEPATFDALVAALCDHPIFTNNSENVQINVVEQVAITLYHLGHYGNVVLNIWEAVDGECRVQTVRLRELPVDGECRVISTKYR